MNVVDLDDPLLGHKRKEFVHEKVPTILTFPTSWKVLEETGLSLARFGDGEFGCITNTSCPNFQPYDAMLSKKLKKVLSGKSSTCLVGLARPHFYVSSATRSHINAWVGKTFARLAKEGGWLDMLSDGVYLDACMTIPIHHYDLPNEYWKTYFAGLRRFFSKLDVILVTGDKWTRMAEYDFYREFAKSITMIECPSENAWKYRRTISENVRRENKDCRRTVVFACGPTATVLAWEMSQEMQCLDLGHLAREYLCFKKGVDVLRTNGAFFGS